MAYFVAVVGCGLVTAAQASIMLPAVPEFDVASQSISDPVESESVPCDSSADLAKDPCPELVQDAGALPAGGASTSTSSSGTGPGGSPLAIGNSIASLSDDADVGGWISGEAHLNLPAPPGNELLRPPQAL